MKIASVCAAVLFLTGCTRENNLFQGRVEAMVGTHQVTVTDCYRVSVPGPEQLDPAVYHYMPCRDADVSIKAEELTVNGKSYGRLEAGDSVLVDHGAVSVGRKQAR